MHSFRHGHCQEAAKFGLEKLLLPVTSTMLENSYDLDHVFIHQIDNPIISDTVPVLLRFRVFECLDIRSGTGFERIIFQFYQCFIHPLLN